MTKSIKALGCSLLLWVTTMLAPAQAGLLTQQIDLTVTFADGGNGFGVSEGWSNPIGVFIYDSAAVDSFWTLTPASGVFGLAMVLGTTGFTELMDADYPDYPVAIFADALATTVAAFEYLATSNALTVWITSFGDTIYFTGSEDGLVTVEGVLNFSLVRSDVDEPAMLSLFLLLAALPLVRRRR